MDLTNKAVMVIGLGKSGADLVAFLDHHAKKTMAFDLNDSLSEVYKDRYPKVEFHFGSNPSGEEEVDLVVISPGIPIELAFVQRLRERGVRIIGEVELAFQMAKGKFIGITGTNGKTTTTALTGTLFKNAGYDARIVGNIGRPIIAEVENADEHTIFVTELSSFQLETIEKFRCHAAAIVNITPDHLNRHKTMENYAHIKGRIFENQTADDHAIINMDDPLSVEMAERTLAQKLFISVNQDLSHLTPSLYIRDNQLIFSTKEGKRTIAILDEIFLKGKHNYENVLIATGIALSFGIEDELIAQTLHDFQGVAHRLEFVQEIQGVRFYNDSKGTNPDASIKALEAIEKNIILIAGGMDKKSSFDEFVKAFSNRVKNAILLGETKHIIAETLDKYGFSNYVITEDMEDAVKKAYEIAVEGDTILLSPACASWDMYSCFEERGEHFKKIVSELEVLC
ncbi:MAG: UDP-N-acetylmuramoyl-L-alanine--D-glutamate ligase [Peptostreptococcaceae bacterium]|nr:UDP-N-acetylmuramoyl-L-alanine--D-glutamate ligase [Peptostreptococcaceae bacterium]